MVNTLYHRNKPEIFTSISTNFGPKPINFEIPVLCPYTQDKFDKKPSHATVPLTSGLRTQEPLVFMSCSSSGLWHMALWSTGPLIIQPANLRILYDPVCQSSSLVL